MELLMALTQNFLRFNKNAHKNSVCVTEHAR